MLLHFRIVVDEPPSTALEAAFEAYWPAYKAWMRRGRKVSAADCLRLLGTHMPELIRPCLSLVERLGGSEEVARFLTLYDPPRVVRACTQLVVGTDSGPVLLRSYDHHPRLFDGLVLVSRWLEARTVAMTDCLWGALDGINEHGLAIALAFGGRNSLGPGFAAPLVCRYILETCASVAEAKTALNRLPVYMPYTFVVVDSAGDFVTAFVGPDRPASFVTRRASANHQGRVEWPAYARSSASADRLERAESLLEGPSSLPRVRAAFLQPPLWRRNYGVASGTLYVAEYAPVSRSLVLHWPGHTEPIGLTGAHDRSFAVELPAATGDDRAPMTRESEQ